MVPRVALMIAVASAAFVTVVAANETRVRVSEGIRYNGFVYKGTHWLEGKVIAVRSDTLSLLMNRGSGGPVSVRLSTVTEVQTRSTFEQDWAPITWPQNDLESFRRSIGLKTSIRQESGSQDDWAPNVAYVEDDGTEVLALRDDVPATITPELRESLGIFGNIRNFESAQYLRTPDGSYAVRLTTYDDNGLTHTALKPVSRVGLQAILRRRNAATDETLQTSARPEEAASVLPSEARPEQRASTLIYGGGAYQFVPASDFSEELKDLGLKVAGGNTGAGSLGAMFSTNSDRNYIDIAVVVYGTRDRIVTRGQVFEADFSVKAIEAAWHRVLISQGMTLTLFTSFGPAIVHDERRFGDLVDVSDEITAWPYSIGFRLIPSRHRQVGFQGFADVRYRWLSLEFRNSQTNESWGFQLGGLFFQLGVMYGL